MEHVRKVYAQLQAAARGPRTEVSTDLKEALKELSAKEAEINDWRHEMEVREKMVEDSKAFDSQKSKDIDRLKRELHESQKKARLSAEELTRALAEKDRALAQVLVESQAARRAKDMLEEEQTTRNRLQQEVARHEESLVLVQSRVAFLESEAYRSEIVEEYRQGIVGKAEVALACKAGYDYLEAQLPAEMRGDPNRFHYPPNVANCLEALEDIERLGGGLDLNAVDAEDEDDGDDDDEATEAPAERTEEGGEGSSGRKDEGAESGSQSTPPPAPTSALPLTPRAAMDLSPSPSL